MCTCIWIVYKRCVGCTYYNFRKGKFNARVNIEKVSMRDMKACVRDINRVEVSNEIATTSNQSTPIRAYSLLISRRTCISFPPDALLHTTAVRTAPARWLEDDGLT